MTKWRLKATFSIDANVVELFINSRAQLLTRVQSVRFIKLLEVSGETKEEYEEQLFSFRDYAG